MSAEYLSRLAGVDAKTIHAQIRESHSRIPKEKCMAWLHAQRFPSKEGGCDIHTEDA